MFEAFALTPEQYEEAMNSYNRKYPLGRIGEVSDTNAAIAYLADNDLASFLTGIVLPVDGGVIIAGKLYS